MQRYRKHVAAMLSLLIAALSIRVAFTQPTPAPAPATATPATPSTTPQPIPPDHGWPDRRPIGVITFSGGGDGYNVKPEIRDGFRTAANPRGWLREFHTGLDVADPRYAVQFDRAVNAWVIQSLDRADRLDCQGVIFWDVEGSEADHPDTYVGEPVRGLPREMTRARVKMWCNELERRKKWMGFTFRDSRAILAADGKPVQVWTPDPGATLTHKIKEARRVYGNNVRCAYWDSDAGEDSLVGGWSIRGPEVAAFVQHMTQDILLIPEFGVPGHEKLPRVAPYRTLDRKSTQAFEVLTPPAGPYTAEQRAEYARCLRDGALTLINVTMDHPNNEFVKQALVDAGMRK